MIVWKQQGRVNGMTKNQYFYLLDKQNSKCGICEKNQDEFEKRLCIDHDHYSVFGSMSIRGILCPSCNSGIAKFQEDPFLIQSAKKYLMERV